MKENKLVELSMDFSVDIINLVTAISTIYPHIVYGSRINFLLAPSKCLTALSPVHS